MTAATPPDPRVVALAREHERTARRVGELDALLRQLATDVATLARPAATGPGRAGDPGAADDEPGVRSWLLAADPDQARADLAELAEWVAAVYLRYAGAALSGCWAWHPDVVEELLCLRQAHADAYTGRGASVQRAGDWHDRLRPHAVERIDKALGNCDLAAHVPGAERDRPAAVTPMVSALDAIADAWTWTREHPHPTSDQLHEDDQRQRAQHARSHHR